MPLTSLLQPIMEESISGQLIKWTPFLITILLMVIVHDARGTKINAMLLNPKKTFEITQTRVLKEYLFHYRSLIDGWFGENPNKPACILTHIGPQIVLPPHMANEIRGDTRLSFTAFAAKNFHTTIPGFAAFKEGTKDTITIPVINKDLTKSLAKVTDALVEEAVLTLPDVLGISGEWQTFNMWDSMLSIIARISSRVFLGEELCRNPDWLRVTREHTSNGFIAIDILHQWPAFLRPLVHWFIPQCQNVRRLLREGQTVIGPIIDKRRAEKAAALARGEKPLEYNDAIDWVEQVAEATGTKYDAATTQLFLSTVAIHTTANLLCATLIDIAKHPEAFEPLRNEIKEVISESGWEKTSLHRMKLLDSALKESQRLRPLQIASMNRIAMTDTTLSDGTFIPKGHLSCVSSHRLWDPVVYPEPNRWDPYRFFRMRQIPGKENLSQLVSTSEDHLGFGHGKHACPGRFFAANELKITLANLLLHYDWEIPEGENSDAMDFGNAVLHNVAATMKFRRRRE
ncbi:Cytochrome P450 monooygenase 1 [Paramyrothecium foliicola]|nr:Cytochrome P450 monooygenase 1 [Paramyrothecium foliicola]